jgi:long-chain acyl-CoA synthetase
MPRSASPDAPVLPAGILARGLAAKPDEVALVSRVRRFTWRELDEISDRLAANLLGLGLVPGDRVASLMPNRIDLVVHYLACVKAGLIATPLNYRYMAPEIDHALEVSGASILLAHAERDADLAASRRAGGLPLGRIFFEDANGREPSLEALMQAEPPAVDLPAPAPDAPAAVFFTSGSTGKPKGVTHSHETLGWLFATAAAAFELTPDDIFLPGCSLSHIGAFACSFTGLGAGARVVVARTFDADEILPLLREDRPTVMVMLPAPLFAVVRDHGAARADFASVRLCMSGGDKVAAELEKEFTETAGFPIDENYGMTEIGFAAVNPPSLPPKNGSVGTLSPRYEMSIRGADGREVATGREGRLWIRSPANMIGYWDNAAATGETIVDGWLDTGDVMAADEDGYLFFHGRQKQIIIHDGSNICPQEVEEALLEHGDIEAAGVVGVHHLVHGENVRAYVTIKPGVTRPAAKTLIDFARARVGYKAPEEIVVLDEMPLNATGKVDRLALKKMAEASLHRAGLA